MKIEGLFLSSRAGRRVFWTLPADAAVPLLLFGLLTHDALDEFFAAQAFRQNVQATKIAGLGVLNRLVVARTVLETIARPDRSTLMRASATAAAECSLKWRRSTAQAARSTAAPRCGNAGRASSPAMP